MPVTPSQSEFQPENFEAALEKLGELVRELEAGDVPLEQSVAAFEEGQRLIKYCQERLSEAEKSLKQIAADLEPVLGKPAK